MEERDQEHEQFTALLADKRHKELVSNLKSIVAKLSDKNDKELIRAIMGQGDKIELLAKSILDMPPPAVNIEYNEKEFVTFIQKISTDIIESNEKLIKVLENRMLPDTFTLIKTYNGTTESVKVNYKSAKEIR
jgi:hypothetical protein